MTKPKAAETEPNAATQSKGWVLQTPPDPPGMTRDQMMARIAADGLEGNARPLVSFGAPTIGELSAAVTMLAAQALALNAIFGELARVGQANMFKAPEYADRDLRLAFKAQGQSRATLETLAAIKNPPVLFARQANISNGGQQQVNNGPAPPDAEQSAQAPARPRPGKTVSEPTGLLEDRTHGRTQLDTRAARATGRESQDLEAVVAVNRTAQP